MGNKQSQTKYQEVPVERCSSPFGNDHYKVDPDIKEYGSFIDKYSPRRNECLSLFWPWQTK